MSNTPSPTNGGGRSRSTTTGQSVSFTGPPRGRHATRVQLTDRDLKLLRFVAAHRFVLAPQVHAWLATDRSIAYRLLGRMIDTGLLRYQRIFHAQPGVFQITNGGLAVIDSPLPKPKLDLRTYRHETGVAWTWVAAQQAAFGPAAGVLTEREMRSHDQRPDRYAEAHAVRLGGYDRAGRPRAHYPDLLVLSPTGERTAVELELSMKGRRRLEQILLAYALDQRFAMVRYLTDQRQIATAVEASSSSLASAGRIRIHLLDAITGVPMIREAIESRGAVSGLRREAWS